MNGIIVVNKKAGYTSRDVVNKLNKILNEKKIGHTGTLDPFATGVLVVCIGKYTKLVELITSLEKEYEAVIELGTLTDTLDLTGHIIKEENVDVKVDKIDQALKEMTKTYNQEVPLYSAIHVKGKRLYEYAKENQKVELPKKEVEIKSLKRISDVTYSDGKIRFTIKTTVSKGTYIRSLVRDIAANLGTIGTVLELKRTKQGDFDIKDSYTLEQIEKNDYKLVDINKIFKNYYQIKVSKELEAKIKNGAILPDEYKKETVLFLNEQGHILALYKKYQEGKIKPWKTFF